MSTTEAGRTTRSPGDHWSASRALDSLLAFAKANSVLRLVQLLGEVCDVQDDSGTLSPVLRLICAADSVQSLADWAQAERELRPWARLAEKVWHARGVLADFPLVSHAIPPEDLYRSMLPTLYIPAVAAIPTPDQGAEFGNWHRRLRLWLVIKAVRAAEAGFPFEPNLRLLCREVRLAGRRGDSSRIAFLRLIHEETGTASRTAFEQSLIDACLRHRGASGDDRTIARLISRVASEAWQVDPETEQRPKRTQGLAPWSPEVSDEAEELGQDPTDAPEDERADSDEGNPDDQEVIPVDEDETPSSQELTANGIHLLNRAAGHMLQWDWHSLVSAERYELLDWVDSMLGPPISPKFRTGAVLIAIAILTSRSARGVIRVQIGADTGTDWKLALRPGLARLHRRPPRSRRSPKSEQAVLEGDALAWLRPLADAWKFDLNARLSGALAEAAPADARSLGDLWRAVAGGEPLDHWLDHQLATHPTLYRLTSPALAGALRTCTYQASSDHVLARLASAGSQTVLPSSCTYGSYVGSTIRQTAGSAFVQLGTWVSGEFDTLNAAGSRLDVDEVRLQIALASLAASIGRASQKEDWVLHHNLLTAYVTVCMLASTGARPTGTPFESFAALDLERGLAFVDDKAVERGSGARICILARPVCDLLRSIYVPHLRQLATMTAPHFGDFAAALLANIEGTPAPKLPMLFFLRFDGEFDWMEVSESGLEEVCGADWPLPWNFTRHRLSTRLRRAGLHAEVIDALMGHGEQGSETHGDHSLRVLGEDLELARPYVERLTAELPIAIPASCVVPELPPEARADRPLIQTSRRFGARRRQSQRIERHAQAKAQAQADIQAAVQATGKPPGAISPQEWDGIGRLMILRADNLRHPFASLRYEVFEGFLSGLWAQQGIKPRLKRRYRLVQAGDSSLEEKALRAESVLAQLAASHESIASSITPSTRPQLCRAMAAVEVCLNCGIADLKVLDRIAQYGLVQPVRHLGHWYIEVFEGDSWIDGPPVRRFQVTRRAVRWLLQGQVEKRTNSKPLPLPASLRPLAAVLGLDGTSTTRRMLGELAAYVDQSNLLRRSGFDAAVLAGRLQVSALPHSDLVRATEGRALHVEDPTTNLGNDEEDDEELEFDGLESQRSARSAEDCRAFLIRVRRILGGASTREESARLIRKECATSGFGEGDMPHALARWAATLLQRPAKGSSDLLDRESVVRYFDSLAPKVTAIAFDMHLIDMDEDELTDLYFNLVRVRIRLAAPTDADPARSGRGRQQDAHRGETQEPVRQDDDPGDVGDTYAVPILREFHAFAEFRFGLEEPDWSLIGDITARPAGRPGLLTQSEYEAALHLLVGQGASRGTVLDLLEQAWVLMICYRFGARGGEAAGLHRSDWHDGFGSVVLLIRPNSTRGLKTPQSKRPVPLIDALSSIEQSVVDEVLRRFDERADSLNDVPLLSRMDARRFKYRRIQITRRLLALLKQITLSSRTTLHHARHSFCCRIFARLSGRSLTDGTLTPPANGIQESTRRLLLGHSGIDRRSLWALARLMGHVSPARLVKSYAHPLVGGLREPQPLHDEFVQDPTVVDLDISTRSIEYLRSWQSPVTNAGSEQVDPTLGTLLNYLRVRAAGRSAARAAWVTGTPPEMGEELEAMLDIAARRQEVLHKGAVPLTTALQLVGRVGQRGLRTLALKYEPVSKSAQRARPDLAFIEMTFGRSGACVLSSLDHIDLAADFGSDLHLTEADVHVVVSSGAKTVRQALEGRPLSALVLSDEQRERLKIQVDRAVMPASDGFGDQEKKDRAALRLAGERSVFVSRYGLVVVWACYIALRSWVSRI